MGLLGSIRKKVNTPLRLRMKRKRTGGEPASLKFASTSEFTEDSSVMESVDSSFQYEAAATKRQSKMEKAVSEDTQELLSFHAGDTDDADGTTRSSSFVFDPIMVSDDDTTDDEKPQIKDETIEVDGRQEDVVMSENDNCLMDDDDDEAMAYVSDDSGDREIPPEQHHHHHHQHAPLSCQVTFIRTHTPPNAMLPTHSRIRSDGQQQQVMHIFHDELATLYEEPNKSSESLDSSSLKSTSSSGSIVNNRMVPLRDTLDESNIRARWEYALQLMVGNCEPSELLYNTLAEMIPSSSITNGDDIMEVAEI